MGWGHWSCGVWAARWRECRGKGCGRCRKGCRTPSREPSQGRAPGALLQLRAGRTSGRGGVHIWAGRGAHLGGAGRAGAGRASSDFGRTGVEHPRAGASRVPSPAEPPACPSVPAARRRSTSVRASCPSPAPVPGCGSYTAHPCKFLGCPKAAEPCAAGPGGAPGG